MLLLQVYFGALQLFRLTQGAGPILMWNCSSFNLPEADGKCHNVGLQPVDHGAGLLARAPVGLLDRNGLPCLGLPILDKSRIKLSVQLSSGIIGDI